MRARGVAVLVAVLPCIVQLAVRYGGSRALSYAAAETHHGGVLLHPRGVQSFDRVRGVDDSVRRRLGPPVWIRSGCTYSRYWAKWSRERDCAISRKVFRPGTSPSSVLARGVAVLVAVLPCIVQLAVGYGGSRALSYAAAETHHGGVLLHPRRGCQEFCARGRFRHWLTNLSPKTTANWAWPQAIHAAVVSILQPRYLEPSIAASSPHRHSGGALLRERPDGAWRSEPRSRSWCRRQRKTPPY